MESAIYRCFRVYYYEMRVALDNIIFSLQRYGGVSVVWNELLTRARADGEIELTELDYVHGLPKRWMERYRTPDWKPALPTVFHSSYFRICAHPLAHNVTTVHDLIYHRYRHGLAKAVHLWEEERALRHSEAIICVSGHTRQDLLHYYPWVKEEKIHVVYNGVGEEFYPMKSIEKKGYLLYVGNRKAAYKRYDIAQEVARLTGMELVVADSPAISREQLNRYYNEAICLLYPSEYEGFGLPVLEAQKAGCPVIAQRVASIPEIMGESGWMVNHGSGQQVAEEMADAVRQLLSGPTGKMIQAGMANAARFSWDTTYTQVKDIYRQMKA